MSRSEKPRVLAIGIDGADPTLIRGWIDGGELPSLKVLLERGAWGRVPSSPYAVSEAVWPTFITGSGPLLHGIYHLWPWRPETMDVSFLNTSHLTPFWKDLAQQGHRVGILDVPYAPVIGLPNAVEIAGWGAHELLHRRPEVHPPALAAVLRDSAGSHPFAHGAVDAEGPHDQKGLSRVVSLCLAGARQRGALMARLLSEKALNLFLAVTDPVRLPQPVGRICSLPRLTYVTNYGDRRLASSADPRPFSAYSKAPSLQHPCSLEHPWRKLS